MRREGYTHLPHRRQALLDELSRTHPTGRHVALGPGFVVGERSRAFTQRPAVAFATQVLPRARHLETASVSTWARGLLSLVAELPDAAPWCLHTLAHDDDGRPVRPRRLDLIDDALVMLMRRTARARLRARRPADGPLPANVHLIQAALLGPERGLVSWAAPETRRLWRHVLSWAPDGAVAVPDDPGPPARAYRKLLEAQAQLAAAMGPGDTCVDLGASPGSWSHVALGQGAKVTALDRAPLRADLMAHPRLTFERGDAFAYAPPAPVDWLICDVIAAPERTLALLTKWLERGLCRRFVVTVKFRGSADYPLLEAFKTLLRQHCRTFGLRVLAHNKNEVTAYGVGVAAGERP